MRQTSTQLYNAWGLTSSLPTTHYLQDIWINILKIISIILYEDNLFFMKFFPEIVRRCTKQVHIYKMPGASLLTNNRICFTRYLLIHTVTSCRYCKSLPFFYFLTFEKADCSIFTLSVGWSTSPLIFQYIEE